MNLLEPELLPKGIDLLDETLETEDIRPPGPVRTPTAELIVENYGASAASQLGEWFEIVMRKAWTTVKREERNHPWTQLSEPLVEDVEPSAAAETGCGWSSTSSCHFQSL